MLEKTRFEHVCLVERAVPEELPILLILPPPPFGRGVLLGTLDPRVEDSSTHARKAVYVVSDGCLGAVSRTSQ